MTKKVTELSLFTGMGGGIYGSLILGWETLAYVERDPYCQKVIKQRIKDGWFDHGPIYGDIKEFNKKHATKYTGKIDVLTGGFPCQPFSVAGKRKGTSDDRYLFDEIIKTIKIIQPRRLLFENVPGILSSDAIIKIYQSLVKIGYRPKAHWSLEVQTVEIFTEENVSGYLPTPRASETQGGRVKNVDMKGLSASRLNKKGVRYGVKLRDVPFEKYMIPTPQAADATVGRIIGKNDTFIKLKSGNFRKINQNGVSVSMGLTRTMMFTLPTPNYSDGSKVYVIRKQQALNKQSKKQQLNLIHKLTLLSDEKTPSSASMISSKDPIYLNPYFVEWLMNYPAGASNLKPSEMDKILL